MSAISAASSPATHTLRLKRSVPSPRKARIEPVRLYGELYQIAGAAPAKGAATLHRVRAICQALYESAPSLRLLEQLQVLQAMMEVWTAETARQLAANEVALLRERLMDIVDGISGLSDQASSLPLMAAA